MKVRDAVVSDIPRLVEMARNLFQASTLADTSGFCAASVATAFRSYIDDPATAFFVLGEPPIGMACALAYPAWWNRGHRTGQEMFWWVEPGHRRAGMQLFNALEEWSRAMDLDTFVVGASESFKVPALERLYRRRGYVPQERLYVRTR